MIGRGPRAWLLYLLVGLLATGGYFLLPSVSAQNVFYNLVGFSSVGAIVVGILMHIQLAPYNGTCLPSVCCYSTAAR